MDIWSLTEQLRSSSRFRKILKWALIVLVVFTITGFFILPPVLKSVLINKLSEQLHRTTSIQEIKVNPFMLSLDIKGFEIKERNGPEIFVSFDELYLNLQTASIFRRGVIISELKIKKPCIRIVRNEDLTYNFSDLAKGEEIKPSEKAEKSGPLKFSLNNIQIQNGKIDFSDLPKHTQHSLSDINAMIPFISNLPYYVDLYVTPSFEAKLNHRQVSLRGETKPFTDTRETTFTVHIKDLDIPYYLEYVPLKMDYKIPSAYLDINAAISYSQPGKRPPLVSLTGNILFKNIEVRDMENNPMIKLSAFAVAVADADLMLKKIHLARVSLDALEVNAVRDKSGRINLQALIPQQEEKKAAQKDEGGPPLVIEADEMDIAQGKLAFSDFTDHRDFKTVVENIDVNVKHFSNGKDKKSAVALALQTESQEGVTLNGEFSLDPLSSDGSVGLKQVLLKKYSPYYRDKVLFDIEDALLDFSTQYSFKKPADVPDVKLSGLTATLNSVKLRQRGEGYDFLSVPIISVKDTDIDLTGRQITVGDVSTERGVFNLRRLSDGKLNVQTLLPPAQINKKPPAPAEKKDEKPFVITLKNLLAEKYVANFNDLVPSEPVKITAGQIKVKGEDLSTGKGQKGKIALSLKLDRTGSVYAGGAVGINPLSANIALNLKNIEIGPFQPYFTDKIKIIVTGGSVMTKGNISVSDTGEAGIKAKFKGEASLLNFASVDKLNADDFLKWESLYVSGIDAGYNPLYVNIKEIALSDFYSRLIVNQDGSLNVQGIIQGNKPSEEEAPKKPPVEEKTEAVQEKKPVPVKIDNLTLQGGAVNFSDNHIKPNYSVNLLEIGGRVSGLSSEETTAADVDLRGKLENYAPLEITGRVNPLKQDLFVDLKADFKDMDLSSLTPYSGRYIGYTIEKGKLSLNLKYLIIKKKLDSQNNVFLDQFTLGDTVESPDATKLPVRLAIALLKDRQGRIDLDIPVSGEIDNPKFSIGRIIIKILLNLLVKAATSPFALLGALFGGGEDLGYVEFDYGSYDITADSAKKLDKLEKALHDRPNLKLDIEGFVDPEKDREGLIQYIFHKKIKAQKLKELVKKGQPAVPVDEIKIETDEYPKYLKMAYKEEKFPKPRNFIGFAKDLPVPEMEKLMLTHIVVKDDDLRQLAAQRSLRIKDYILKSGQVEPERVFLIMPKSLKPEQKEKVKDSRVDFKLK
jgi:uncharacterized protein involved in outer membrane biogenesis